MMNQAYKDAEEKIEIALRSQATELDISGGGTPLSSLTALPESLSRLTQLEKLVLSRNRLRELPSWFGQLAKLKALDLSDNRLKVFPEWIDELRELEWLNVAFNRVQFLPESRAKVS